MRLLAFVLPALALAQFIPAPGNFPATGDGDFAGGIFCISPEDLEPWIAENGGIYPGSEAYDGRAPPSEGSGPYKAHRVVDDSLPGHTIYAPKTPPPNNVKIPFLTWGNGACATNGAEYENFLLEVASHGYVIAANGLPTGDATQSAVQDVRDSLDWAFDGGADKYGKIDLSKVATMGHSCGGLEAMSVAYKDPRVKHIMLFNIAIFQDERRYLLSQIDVPVAYFIGGVPDMGYLNSEKDYALLPSGLPAIRANLDTGHGGTFHAPNGGKYGKAAVAYLEWQFRKNQAARDIILKPESENSLVKDNWEVEHKNWLKKRCPARPARK